MGWVALVVEEVELYKSGKSRCRYKFIFFFSRLDFTLSPGFINHEGCVVRKEILWCSL